VILQPTPQSSASAPAVTTPSSGVSPSAQPAVTTAPVVTTPSTGGSGLLPPQSPMGVITTPAKPGLQPSNGPLNSSTASVNNGYDLCALASKGLLYNAKRAFIIGETLYFGNGTHFYRAIMTGNQWVYFDAEDIHNIFADSNHFTEIISAVFFGSQQQCTQTQANCAIMTNAFDKTLVIGSTGPNVFAYKAYYTKDIGVGGHELLPIHPVTDAKHMPWGLPASDPLTDPFWPQDKGLIVKCLVYDTIKQSLYISVFHELSGQQHGNNTTEIKVYIRQIDGQLAGNYRQMEATSNFTAMVYRNGQTFGIRENIQGSWYYLDFTDPTKSNLVIHSQERQVKEFLNCQKTSPLLDQVSPSSAPNTSVSSGDQSSALSPIGDQTTSGDIGIGSTHKNGTTSAAPEKSSKT
ncbi:unnamed protein product, partial [Medioppia subpectinata]